MLIPIASYKPFHSPLNMPRFNLHDLPRRYHSEVTKQLYGQNKAGCEPSSAIVESSVGDGALAEGQTQKADSGVYQVRVVSFRVRLCDEDNLAEKYHVDALRYLGIIPDDSPDKCHILTTQEKVKTKKEERTEITISF